MDHLDLSFCTRCSEKILNRKLRDFWRLSCVNSITNAPWIRFNESDELVMKYLKVLEKKNFIITLDHGDEVLLKPRGIHQDSKHSYVVCLTPSKHFTEVTQGGQ